MMKKCYCAPPIKTVFLAIMLIAISSTAIVADTETDDKTIGTNEMPYSIPRTDKQIVLDGLVNEELWENAWVYEIGYEVRPGDSTPAPVKTEVFMTYDGEFFYFGFKCYDDDPSKIVSHINDRDQLFGDDWVGVVLDTMNDERQDLLLLVSPLNSQLDVIEVLNGNSQSWDAIWDSAATITDWGWSAEMKIPFKSIRFQRTGGEQIWGFDGVRGWPRETFHQMGAFVRDRNDNCYQCNFIKIKGFDGITPGRNLEVVPTVTAVNTDTREDFPDGDFANTNRESQFGVTARWGVTPNINLSATLNPDFSQVESDVRQLDVNQPFALSYPERRPFFMEGSDYFGTPMDAIYTRTLRNPDWGLKITGKEGKHTIGAYTVQDSVTNLIFPGAQGSNGTSLSIDSLATVVRYKYDANKKLTLGGLFANRQGDEYSNNVFGIDADYRISNKDVVQFQMLGTSTKYPDQVAKDFGQKEGEFSDSGMLFAYFHNTESLNIRFTYKERGEDLRVDSALIPQVGIKDVQLNAFKIIRNEDSWWNFFGYGAVLRRIAKQNNEPISTANALLLIYNGTKNSALEFIASQGTETYLGMEYDKFSWQGNGGFRPNNNSSINFDYFIGDRIDYSSGRLGYSFRVSPSFDYSLTKHIKLAYTLSMENMTVGDEKLFNARIHYFAMRYQFSTRMYLRGQVQYIDNTYNVDNYAMDVEPDYQQVLSQILFSYKLNPRTVLFLGYNDNYFGADQLGIVQADRTLFMKIGYAWQL
jgi:hypothetical protein